MVDKNRKYHGVLTILENARALIQEVITFKAVDYKQLDKNSYELRLAQAIDIMAERLSYHGQNDTVYASSILWNSLSALKAAIGAVPGERTDEPIPDLAIVPLNIALFKLSMVYLYVLDGLNVEKCPDSRDYLNALSSAGSWLTKLTVTGPNQLQKELIDKFAQFSESDKEELLNFAKKMDLPVLQTAFEKNMSVKVVDEMVTKIEDIKKMTLTAMPILSLTRLIKQARQAKLRMAGVRLLSVDNESNIAPETFSRSQPTIVKYPNKDNASGYRVYQYEWDKHFLVTIDTVPTELTDFRQINLANLPLYSAGIVRVRGSNELYYFSTKETLLTLKPLAPENISSAYLNQTYPVSVDADKNNIELTNADLSSLFIGDLSAVRVKQRSFELDSKKFESPQFSPEFPVSGQPAIEIKPVHRTNSTDQSVNPKAKADDPNNELFKEISRASRQLNAKPALSLSEQKVKLDKDIQNIEGRITEVEEALNQVSLEIKQSSDASATASVDAPVASAVVAVNSSTNPSSSVNAPPVSGVVATTATTHDTSSTSILLTGASFALDLTAQVVGKFLGGEKGAIPAAIHSLSEFAKEYNTPHLPPNAVEVPKNDDVDVSVKSSQHETMGSAGEGINGLAETSKQSDATEVLKAQQQQRQIVLTDELKLKKEQLEKLKTKQKRLDDLLELKKNLVEIDLEKLQKISAKARAYLDKMSERIQAARQDNFQLPDSQTDENILVDLREALRQTKDDIKTADESYKTLLRDSEINDDFRQELEQWGSHYNKVLTRQNELEDLCWKIKAQEDKLSGIEKNFSALNKILLQPMRRIQHQFSSSILLQWGGKVLPYLALLAGATALTIGLGILLSNPHFLAIFVIPSLVSITTPLAITGVAVGGAMVLATATNAAKVATGYRLFKAAPKDKDASEAVNPTAANAETTETAKTWFNPFSSCFGTR